MKYPIIYYQVTQDYNINILNPFIKINNTNISKSFILLILIIIYLISLTIIKYKNIFATKKQRTELKT